MNSKLAGKLLMGRHSLAALPLILLNIPTFAGAAIFDLSWYTVDCGGQTFSTGGAFTLGGTIAQHDAGTMSGGTFTLAGGFWPGVSTVPPCDGDANSDGVVDPLDAGYVLSRFGCDLVDPDCQSANVNSDGVVDPLDVGFVLARFGECP